MLINCDLNTRVTSPELSRFLGQLTILLAGKFIGVITNIIISVASRTYGLLYSCSILSCLLTDLSWKSFSLFFCPLAFEISLLSRLTTSFPGRSVGCFYFFEIWLRFVYAVRGHGSNVKQLLCLNVYFK
jgi:hypothetical protein